MLAQEISGPISVCGGSYPNFIFPHLPILDSTNLKLTNWLVVSIIIAKINLLLALCWIVQKSYLFHFGIYSYIYPFYCDPQHLCRATNPLNHPLKCDGSKDDLDWRIDFRYFNFIWFMKKIEIYSNLRFLLHEFVSFSHSLTCDLTSLGFHISTF